MELGRARLEQDFAARYPSPGRRSLQTWVTVDDDKTDHGGVQHSPKTLHQRLECRRPQALVHEQVVLIEISEADLEAASKTQERQKKRRQGKNPPLLCKDEVKSSEERKKKPSHLVF